jgi:hypothetical protein
VKWAAATDFQKVSILDEAKNSYVESQQLVILEKALKDFRLIKRRALIVAKTIDYANLLLKRTDAVISSHLWGQLTQAQKSIFLEVRNISVEDSFYQMNTKDQFEELPPQYRGEYRTQDKVDLISVINEHWHKSIYSDNNLLL